MAGGSPVRYMPITRRAGVYIASWSAADYATFFANVKGWTYDQTINQPIGFLDRLADAVIQPALAEQAKQQKVSAVETLTVIAGGA